MAKLDEKKKSKHNNLKVRTIVLCGVIFIGAVMLSSSCDSNSNVNISTTSSSNITESVSAQVNTVGNTPANLANGGWVAVQGDWVYYAVSSGLYKEKIDGGSKQKLLSLDSKRESVYSLNVVGDWIYYFHSVGQGTSASVKKMKIDGTNIQKLMFVSTSDCSDSSYIAVVGDWIYYYVCKFNKDNSKAVSSLEKMKIDGTGQITVFQNPDQTSYIGGFSLGDDGWIYYVTYPCLSVDVAGTLYRVKIDGSGSMKLADNCYYEFAVVDNGWIYGIFTDKNDIALSVKNLYRINPSDAGKELIIKEVEGFNIADGWIYYTGNTVSNTIEKITVDGENGQKLTDTEMYPDSINIVENWLYYMCRDGVYRIRLDGTSLAILESIMPSG